MVLKPASRVELKGEPIFLNNETQSETRLELFQVSRQFIPREVLMKK